MSSSSSSSQPKNWCPTCDEICTDHPSVCTICGETLQTKPPPSSRHNATDSSVARIRLSRGGIQNDVDTAQLHAALLRAAATLQQNDGQQQQDNQDGNQTAEGVGGGGGGGAGAGPPITWTPAALSALSAAVAQNPLVEEEVWERPPPEALDPQAASANRRSRPTSEECINRIPRIVLNERSAILHEAFVECVPPPPPPPPPQNSVGSTPPTTGTTTHANNKNNGIPSLRGNATALKFSAIIGEFGPSPPYELTGRLILSKPLLGCKKNTNRQLDSNIISTLKTQSGGKGGGILYMERGGSITFASKALQAQDAGAKAVVVGNNVAVWPYVMKDSTNESRSKLKIPIVMIKRSDGRKLKQLVQRHSDATVQCTIRANKLQSSSSSSSSGGGSSSDCVVCRETFEIGDTIIRLPFCSHCFHEQCALMWLRKHNTCPYCRRELPTDDAEYEAERRRVRRTHHVGGSNEDGNVDRSDQWESLFG